MGLRKLIQVRARFVAFHCWPDAPTEVAFLRDMHRHEFRVVCHWRVSDSNRELEFFIQQRKLVSYLREKWEGTSTNCSCEQIAEAILRELECSAVEVSEDGENGATVLDVERYREEPTREINNDRIHLQRRESPFVGVEAEGPWIGEWTLFVPATGVHRVAPPSLLAAQAHSFIVDELKIRHIYIGAGNVRAWSAVLIRQVLETYRTVDGMKFSVEVDASCGIGVIQSMIELLRTSLCPAILCIVADSLDGSQAVTEHLTFHDVVPVFVKTITKTDIHWFQVGTHSRAKYDTPLNSPLFKFDQELY